MENINQDAMMHARPATPGSDTGGPMQVPNDREMMNDDAAEDSARMVDEGSDDSADDSASLTTPNPALAKDGGPADVTKPLGHTNPEDAPVHEDTGK